ncbi:hypothetical protein C8R34_104133 [Nitrosomonas sp. Nm84]|uniref:hypothetical protein n=1 Tax=Nitrosomonas sp. Nm84 TaxID=200124 RepID=UPI000D999FB3|nr:hypothetical protein [Nitrosomonas sp. Nm84]PXW89730.1 hypothetical protein C8R34_104133 [Nitrosomonas sp. Nm84]
MIKLLKLMYLCLFLALTSMSVQAQKTNSATITPDEGVSACHTGLYGNTGLCEDQLPKAIKKETARALEVETASVPSAVCRAGYLRQGSRLCMTGTRGPATFANAVINCQDSGGRVADYGDWRYRIFRGDGIPAPVSWWLGPNTGDNEALFVNSANVGDYDGVTSRFDNRSYACAHDLSF